MSNTDAALLAAPLVTLLILALLRKGAFFQPDVVVSPALVSALALSSAGVRAWLRAHFGAVVAIAVGAGGWILDAAISDHSVDTWRLPAFAICLVAGYGCARCLPAKARGAALAAVATLGGAMAVAALVLVGVRSTLWTLLDERSLRFSGPLTYPSAAGLFMVVALIAGAQAWPGRRHPAMVPATMVRLVTVLGVIATDSRGAVLGLVVALFFRQVRDEIALAVVAAVIAGPLLLLGQRTDGNRLLVGVAVAVAVGLAFVPDAALRRVVQVAAAPAIGVLGWLLVTQHHVVSGLDASWTERVNILRGAASLLAKHPWFGAGPDPLVHAHTLTGQPGIAFFTHNEPVEILVSVGVIGALGLLGCVALFLRSGRPPGDLRGDLQGPLVLPVLATAASAGVVDFGWHFPALGLACGIVAGASRAQAARADPRATLS